jgi:hypothetical protein
MSDLEKAVDENLKIQHGITRLKYMKPEVFEIVEHYMKKNKLIGYGGHALNLYLPPSKQFYNLWDIPDYDFFSPHAIQDCKRLAKELALHTDEVEVKSAMFDGTYKIFVNFIPLVDITHLEENLYNVLWKSSRKIEGIHYVPYSYLKMSLYLELSRPLGDVGRWSKIYKRLQLLEEEHPTLIDKSLIQNDPPPPFFKTLVQRLQPFVLAGEFGLTYYQNMFPIEYRQKHPRNIMVFTEDVPSVLSLFQDVSYNLHFYKNKFCSVCEVSFVQVPMLYIISLESCQSYNILERYGKKFKIATYDTILSTYYALTFLNIPSLPSSDLLLSCSLLTACKDKKTKQMRRFRMPCIGYQPSLEDLRKRRGAKYTVYKKTGKYKHLFFRYRPNTKKTKR